MIQGFWREILVLPNVFRRLALPSALAAIARFAQLQYIGNFLVQALRYDAIFFVERLLFGATTFGLAYRPGHRVGNSVTVEDRFTIEVTRRTANGLD
ncbi:hypothetical protein D3C78_1783990 [compost metagenome]